jgi:hypothetical protein
MYYYWAYGLKICSEIEFPELYPISEIEKHDLVIEIGSILMHSQEGLYGEEKKIYISSKEFKLNVSCVANYWAENGNKIIIQPDSNSEISKVRLFCLSNVFAAILHQRGVIPIHSAAILVKNRLVMICGQSGAGKSTLLASLREKGFSVFSDDVCVPVTRFNEVLMYASYPMMKYWAETIKRLPSLGKPDVQLRPDLNKFGYYYHNQFSQVAFAPALVFFLEISNQVDQVEISSVKGYGLFQYFESNAYRGEYLSAVDLKQAHFYLFSTLANQVLGFSIKRPNNHDSIDEVTNLVVSLIEKELN